MSILAVVLKSDRAIVSMDTKCQDEAGATSERAKFVVFPRHRAVLCAVGASLPLHALASLSLLPQPFDTLCDDLGTVSQRILDELMQQGLADGIRAMGSTLVLVGVSARSGSARAVSADLRTDGQRFIVAEHGPGTVVSNPTVPGFRFAGPEPADACLVRLAKAQCRIADELKQTAGGRLLVTEIRRDSVQVRDLGPIEA